MSPLHLTVNGDSRTVPGPATVTALLGHLGLDPRMVVVEVNREVVRRARHDAVSLHDGDVVELVHFVGGG
jgi:sulfur carrier protein